MRFLLITILSLLLSCSNQEDQPKPIVQPTLETEEDQGKVEDETITLRIDEIYTDGLLTHDFHYENDRLSQIDLYNPFENKIYGMRIFSYQNDVMTGMEEVFETGYNRIHSFTYKDGKIVRSDERHINSDYISFDMYSYDSSGNLIQFQKYEGSENDTFLDDDVVFEYDDNNNLLEVIRPNLYLPFPYDEVVDFITITEVDDKVNPFQNYPLRVFEGMLYYTVWPIEHNIVKTNELLYENLSDFRYNYNLDNHPSSLFNLDGHKVEYRYL